MTSRSSNAFLAASETVTLVPERPLVPTRVVLRRLTAEFELRHARNPAPFQRALSLRRPCASSPDITFTTSLRFQGHFQDPSSPRNNEEHPET